MKETQNFTANDRLNEQTNKSLSNWILETYTQRKDSEHKCEQSQESGIRKMSIKRKKMLNNPENIRNENT